MIQIMRVMEDQKVRASSQEEESMGSLAVPGHLEENVSHRFALVSPKTNRGIKSTSRNLHPNIGQPMISMAAANTPEPG